MKAYFVIGPEASGTRFLTQCLLASTNGFGDCTHEQRLGDTDELVFPEPLPSTIVFRRSMPHGQYWPRLEYIIQQMQDKGYKVEPIFIVRDMLITVKSQIKAGHVKDEATAIANIRTAWRLAFSELPIYPIVVTYLSLIHEESFKRFFQKMKLPIPNVEIIDGNKKYLEL